MRNPKTAYLVLALMPLFFSSNLIFGRVAASQVEPFTLAFLRWAISGLVLFLVSRKQFFSYLPVFKRNWQRILLLGFLGMWVCGAVVYVALDYTTASNGTLIYASSPVIIIVIERIFRGRQTGFRELTGVAIAVLGIFTIVLHGDVSNLYQLDFNVGDLLFVFCAICWALYSVLLKSDDFAQIPTLPMFTVVALAGAVSIFPFAVAEIFFKNAFPVTAEAWLNISGIVIFASIIAFSSYQYGVKMVGAAVASMSLYLLPIYGVGLAWLLLGEQLYPYHAVGIVLVLGGIILATFPAKYLHR